MTARVQQGEAAALGPAQPSTEELRVALALNGGVSLAVWMGGCAVELDRARRASERQSPRRVYDVLCDCLGRRLVLDILTGTSAGGINGALLGAAMARDGLLPADFVRGRWIELGDLTKILHDPAEESPTALMDGKEFHAGLLETFEELARIAAAAKPGERGAPIVPSLDVTMTDTIGVERRFRDAWGGELVAREHRPRFKFRERRHFTPAALAAASRTTASFPLAFDPWLVEGDARVLTGIPNRTYGIDGGLLDNAPIRAALELIPERPASAAVRRYVCYLNADPTARSEETIGELPGLKEVGSHVLNLPRTAPLVDHLYAIRDAVERPQRTRKIQDELLRVELGQLRGVAAALFGAYCKRRALESLEELLSEPGDANALYDLIGEVEGSLPWIPRQWRPGSEPRWEWGMRPAQRILHVLLDLLRPAIAAATTEDDRRELLEKRVEIERQLNVLAGVRDDVTGPEVVHNPSRFDEEKALERVNKAAAKGREQAADMRAAVVAAAAAFRSAVDDHPALFEAEAEVGQEPLGEALFGAERGAPQAEIDHFLERMLSIEVVRRAFGGEADLETAEELSFVQLTPDAPSPIFTADPLALPSPASAKQKLTGVALGHFAGFFRRSWRANDYMWGRLDAAARIVDLLLDEPTKEVGVGAKLTPACRRKERASKLAEGLLAGAGPDGRWLIEEVMPAPEEGQAPLPLADQLRTAIEIELGDAEEGKPNPLALTRALFQRAAQLEILREELPILREQSQLDSKRGSAAAPLELGGATAAGGPPTGVRAEIEGVRRLYAEDSSLPEQLTGKGEAVSTLGLQTISHAAFVALNAIRTAGVPMSKYLGLARPPLLAVAGTVVSNWFQRATALLGFWAAAIYLTSRVVTEAGVEPTFEAIWSPQTLVALVLLLGALGFVSVPGLRARQGVSKFKNLLYATGLVLSAGGLAAALGLIVADLSVEQVLFAPGAEQPPEWALWTVLGVIGAVSLARLPLPSWLSGLQGPLERVRHGGHLMVVLLAASFVLLAAFAGQSLVRSFDEGWWQAVAAATALGLAPVAAGCVVRIWRLR